jgi:hypothetical protein
VKVHAALPVAARAPGRGHGFDVVELGDIRAAATLVHCGSMDHVLPAIQALARWIDASGYRDDWVTELAEPITN